MDCSIPGFSILYYFLVFAQIYVHWVQMLYNHLTLCCPLLWCPQSSQHQCMSVSHSVMSNSCYPMLCSPPGFSVHSILQARILEWITIPFSRGSSWPRDRTLVSCIAGRFFIVWATGKYYIRVFSNESALHIKWPNYLLEVQLQHISGKNISEWKYFYFLDEEFF